MSTLHSGGGCSALIGIGAMPAAAAVTALMGGDAFAVMEDLDGAIGCPQIDLLADQRMGHGAEEASRRSKWLNSSQDRL